MALPTFKAAGTFTAGTGAVTPPYPAAPNAPVAGDIALLVCESENQAISLTTPNGFVELGLQANKAAGTAATDPASRLAVYWKRCVGGDAAPVVADSGNHTTGQIYLYTGCIATGNPWDVYAEGNDGGANDLTGVIPGATTTVADCLIVLICSSSYNGTSTTEFSGWRNGDLANILERGDNTNTAGLGGGHGLATGEKASAGVYGDTTVTLAHTSYKGAMSIALKPPVTQTFYQAEAGAVSFAADVSNRLSLHIAHLGALSFAGLGSALVKSAHIASLAFSGLRAGKIAYSLAGVVSFTGADTKTARPARSSGLSFAGAVSERLILHAPHLGSLSFAGLRSALVKLSHLASLAFSGTRAAKIFHSLVGAVGFTGSLRRTSTTRHSGQLSPTGEANHRLTARTNLTGAVSFLGTLLNTFIPGAAVAVARRMVTWFGTFFSGRR